MWGRFGGKGDMALLGKYSQIMLRSEIPRSVCVVVMAATEVGKM